MTIHENANVGEFIRAATIERPGVATSVARLRSAPTNADSARSTDPPFWSNWAVPDSRWSAWEVAPWWSVGICPSPEMNRDSGTTRKLQVSGFSVT